MTTSDVPCAGKATSTGQAGDPAPPLGTCVILPETKEDFFFWKDKKFQ